MRLLYKANVFGWVMTGFMGKSAKWFLGFSRVPTERELAQKSYLDQAPE